MTKKDFDKTATWTEIKMPTYPVCMMYVPRSIQEAASRGTPIIIITPAVQRAIDAAKG